MIQEYDLIYAKNQNSKYLKKLYKGLIDEIRIRKIDYPQLKTQLNKIEKKAFFFLEKETEWRDYYKLCDRLSILILKISTISQPYLSMEDFWEDALLQSKGKSPFTFWDIYEHGARRSLEKRFSNIYYSEDAILLNCGMSAISVALNLINFIDNDEIVVSKFGYFETSELLNKLIYTRNIKIIHLEDFDVKKHIKVPKIAILEIANSTPGSVTTLNEIISFLVKHNVFIIVDTSLYGPSIKLIDLFKDYENVIFVESTAKFICRKVMGGLIYGKKNMVDIARLYARGSGQLLQAVAFQNIRFSEIDNIYSRLNIHKRNLLIFKSLLGEVKSFLNLCNQSIPNIESIDTGGCILFIRLIPKDNLSLSEIHRKIINSWIKSVKKFGIQLRVRAGYGWDNTTVRCYESIGLKQNGVDDYIRISIGIEQLEVIQNLSNCLSKVIQDFFNE